MPDDSELLEQWLAAGQQLLAARKGSQREQALEQRLAALEQRGADPADLDDEAVERWLARAGDQLERDYDERRSDERDEADDDDDDDGDGDGEEEQQPEPRRPRQQLRKRNVPKIWSGKDEPDHVEYLDEQGAVKVRPGRKRGHPYEYDVDDLPDNDDDDQEEEMSGAVEAA